MIYENKDEIKENPIEKWAEDGLSTYVEKCWHSAKQAKIEKVEPSMVKALRLRQGKYTASELEQFAQIGMPPIFVKLTALKCRAASAWLNEISNQSAENLYVVEPTPVPELNPEVEDEIKQKTIVSMMNDIEEITNMGYQLNPEYLFNVFNNKVEDSLNKINKEIYREAKERASKMGSKIEDILIEGNYYKEIKKFIHDLTIYSSAFLKWPVFSLEKELSWKRKKDKYSLQVDDVVKPFVKRVNPFDIYPDPASAEIKDSWVIERHRLTRKELSDMKDLPYYDSERISKALAMYESNGLQEWLWTDTERAELSQKNLHSVLRSDRIDAIEFHGYVRGQWLIDWGYEDDEEEDLDADKEYYCCLWKIGKYVIKAVIDYDPLDKCPYRSTSWSVTPDSVWGEGIPELIEPLQRMCNAMARSIANNATLASGPQIEVDSNRCNETWKIWPNRIWLSTANQMQTAPAVRFNIVPFIADRLMQVYEFFSALADEMSGIPRLAYGQSQKGIETASGQAMAMDAAGRVINDVVSNLSDVVADIAKSVYFYEMLYGEDDSVKGDLNISTKGISGILTKKQDAIRRQELLTRILSSQILVDIVGQKELANMLRETIRATGIDPGEIGEADELEDLKQQQIELQQTQIPGQELSPSGAPAGGGDFNLYQGVRQ